MKQLFTTSQTRTEGKLYVEPRRYATRVTGPKRWFGTGSGLVREDVADERMRKDGYGKGLEGLVETDDAEIESRLKEMTSGPLNRFEKRFTVKKQNDDLGKWLDLGVYTSATDPRIFFFDEGIAGGPKVLYAEPSEEIVMFVVDAPRAEDVKLLAAAYNIQDERLIKKVQRRLEREAGQ